jgi:hypothetical protein
MEQGVVNEALMDSAFHALDVLWLKSGQHIN